MTDELEQSAVQDPHWSRSVKDTGSKALAMTPVPGAGRLAQFIYDRRDRVEPVTIFIVVSVALIIAAGGALAWAYAYCVDRGGSFDGGLEVDWGSVYADLRFKCTQ